MFSQTKLTILFILTSVTIFVWYATTAESAVVTKGLVSYWTLDQSTIENDTVEDIFGDNDGKIIGEPEIVEGVIGEALHFDGEDDYVEVESNESLTSEEYSIDTFVFGDGPPTVGGAVRQWIAKGQGCGTYVFSWDHSGGEFVPSIAINLPGGGWSAAKIDEKLKGEEWYHIVGTWDGSKLKIYLNGKLSKETKVSGSPVIDDGPVQIGGCNKVGNMFKGAVDEVRIYNRALTEDEILNNFQDKSQLAVINAARKLSTFWGKIKSLRN